MVVASLANEAEFLKFENMTIEHTIRREGRLFSPCPKFSVTGLEQTGLYQMNLSLERVGDHPWSYREGNWEPKNPENVMPRLEVHDVEHGSGIVSGKEWIERVISFDNLRITNKVEEANSFTIFLETLCKYIPVFKIHKIGKNSDGEWKTTQTWKFSFEETAFIVVSNYASSKVCDLKTSLNKFAHRIRKVTVGEMKERRKLQRKERSRKAKMMLAATNTVLTDPSRRSGNATSFSTTVGPNNQFPNVNGFPNGSLAPHLNTTAAPPMPPKNVPSTSSQASAPRSQQANVSSTPGMPYLPPIQNSIPLSQQLNTFPSSTMLNSPSMMYANPYLSPTFSVAYTPVFPVSLSTGFPIAFAAGLPPMPYSANLSPAFLPIAMLPGYPPMANPNNAPNAPSSSNQNNAYRSF